MKIGIDIRSLAEKKYSGVSEYSYNLLNNLFRIDQGNQYYLFANAYHQKTLPDFSFENVAVCYSRIPNKLLNFSLKFFKYPKLDKLVAKKFKLEKLDLFFLPNLNFVSLSDDVAKVITVHDLSFERYPKFFNFKKRLWHRLVNPRSLINSADKIISVSLNTKNDLTALYQTDQSKIEVIYPGSRPRKELSSAELTAVKNKHHLPDKFFLYLGTLEPRKNITGLIKSFDIYKSKYWTTALETYLVLAGSGGWLMNDILEAINASPNKEYIKLPGYVDAEDKAGLYQLADVFIYPSFYEGFGFPPLEAMAAGTPVIASHSSSLAEVLADSCLLADPYNSFELAYLMNYLTTDQELRQDLIERGLEKVKQFSWQKTAAEIKKLFEENANRH